MPNYSPWPGAPCTISSPILCFSYRPRGRSRRKEGDSLGVNHAEVSIKGGPVKRRFGGEVTDWLVVTAHGQRKFLLLFAPHIFSELGAKNNTEFLRLRGRGRGCRTVAHCALPACPLASGHVRRLNRRLKRVEYDK